MDPACRSVWFEAAQGRSLFVADHVRVDKVGNTRALAVGGTGSPVDSAREPDPDSGGLAQHFHSDEDKAIIRRFQTPM